MFGLPVTIKTRLTINALTIRLRTGSGPGNTTRFKAERQQDPYDVRG